MVLGLEELEKIYQFYHGTNNENDFIKAKSIIRDKNSSIPLLGKESLFFTCYDDTVYESVLDD